LIELIDELVKAAAEATAKVTGGSLDVLINNAAYLSLEGVFNAIDELCVDVVVRGDCILRFISSESDEMMIKSFNENWNTNVLGVVFGLAPEWATHPSSSRQSSTGVSPTRLLSVRSRWS